MVLLATTGPGVVRAERRAHGAWHVERPMPKARATCLAVDPNDRRRAWAGTRDAGVLRSDDTGRSWRSAGGPGRPVTALTVSAHDPEVAYAGVTPVGLYVTRDGGASWTELTGLRRARAWWWFSPADPPGLAPYVSALAVSPTDPQALLLGVEAGAVLRSEDGGSTWSSHRRRADRDCHALQFHRRDGAWAYEAGGGGPASSRDGGRTWRHGRAGLAGRYAVSCAADPERPEVWYVATSPLAAWPRIWRMPVAHDPGRAHATIYRASGGADWQRLEGGLPQPLAHAPYGLATDPNEPGHLYAGLADGQVWRSTDHGEVWTKLPVDLGRVRRSMVLA